MKSVIQPLVSLIASLLPLILLPTLASAQQPSESFQMIRTGPGLSLHKDMFMLPASYSDEYHESRTEAVFQISAKHRLFNSRFYFAYTQISFWQAYDRFNSAPFRETDYNPEIFYRTRRFPFHAGEVGADVGFEHESNGQRPPISRSWNLFYVSPYYYRSNLLLYLKLRYRVHEKGKESPEAAVGDDNPDITDYLGYNELHVYCRFWRRQLLHLMVQGNPSTGKGGMGLDYSVPVPRSEMSFFTIRISQGYGESLVDYKKSLTRIGVGIMFMR